MSDGVLYQFTSHTKGKNAQVSIYPDRIEWVRDKKRSKTAAFSTMGASLLTSKKQGASEMMPMRAVTSVATKRDGMRNTIVSVIAAGNTVDFRVSHDEAENVKSAVQQAMANLA